jgi:hypothetical protein
MNIIKARNPKWSNKEKTTIDLIVKFSDIDEEVPFTANPNDPEPIGKEIFNRAIFGEFGSIAQYVPPAPPSLDFIKNQVRYIRNEKLVTEVDPIVSNPLRWESMTEEQQNAWKTYRLKLLDITQNPNFPWYEQVLEKGIDAVPWPVKPKE